MENKQLNETETEKTSKATETSKTPAECCSLDVATEAVASMVATVPLTELAGIARSIRGTLVRRAVLARLAPAKSS